MWILYLHHASGITALGVFRSKTCQPFEFMWGLGRAATLPPSNQPAADVDSMLKTSIQLTHAARRASDTGKGTPATNALV